MKAIGTGWTGDNSAVVYDMVDELLAQARQASHSMNTLLNIVANKVSHEEFIQYAEVVKKQLDAECALFNLKWTAVKIGGWLFA